MNRLLYYLISGIIGFIQMLPLDWVAHIGRCFGALAYYCDARHRRVAQRNLARCFSQEKSPREIRALSLENFKRIGENFSCAIKTVSMTPAQVSERLELAGVEKIAVGDENGVLRSIILAIGHFGNFEVFGQMSNAVPTHQRATTYRALNNPAADRLLLRLRESTGSLYFERRTDGAALRAALRKNDLLLGLLADQHSGDHGLRLPFLGHECNTTKSPAVFALRFNAPLYTAICYRTKLAHWRIEVGDEISTCENGQPRELAAIMLDVNRAFEVAVRRDPANWFWVHNRWKNSRIKTSATTSAANFEGEVQHGG